jgi:quercetin dioxygenase-like cupin family protein
MKKRFLPYLLIAAATMASAAYAAAPTGLSRTVVTTGDVGEAGYQATIAKVTLAPGGTSGRHTHPGDEISYITGGSGELLIDGDAPRTVKAGEGVIVPTGKIHEFRNPGTEPLTIVGVYYVKKGEPLATPAK